MVLRQENKSPQIGISMFTQDVTQCASMTCRRKEIFFRRILLTVNPAAFGRNVRRYRGKDTSATELASRLGVGKSLISGWEHGTKGLPQAPTLLRLAKALGVTVDDLLVGVEVSDHHHPRVPPNSRRWSPH